MRRPGGDTATELMSTALVWSRTSPRLCEDMRSSGLLILPHRVTLRRLTSALSVQDGLEIGTIKYLEMRLAKLSLRGRLVNLAMDEVYCAKSLELAGGRLYGESSDGAGCATNTLFCTHISSVAGNYEDLVTMSPVSHITTEKMKDIFFKLLRCLTQLGYRVVSVTTADTEPTKAFIVRLAKMEVTQSSSSILGVSKMTTESIPCSILFTCSRTCISIP